MSQQNGLEVIIVRDNPYPNGTEGHLTIQGINHAAIYTLEEPWKDNSQGISCIPKGTYHCVPHGWEENSHFHEKQCWEITNVPNRTSILIHTGNSTADTLGCILVGLSRKYYNGALKVLQSKDAMAILRKVIGNNPFELEIK